MSTYLYPLFEAKGRIFFNGESGSGKSRQQEIYTQLSFNPISSSNISGASIYRIIESTGGTLLIDDYDKVQEDQKKDVDRCIRVGYKKNQKAIRSEGRSFTPTGFDVYSPMLINNITGLDEVTESRCFKITTLKINTEITRKKLNADDEKWQKWRDDMHICTLQNWKDVKDAYQKFDCVELAARNLEVVDANLVLAKLIDYDLYKEVLVYCKETFEQNTIKDLENDWTYLTYKELLNQADSLENQEGWIPLKDVIAEVATVLWGECPERDDFDYQVYIKKKSGLSITMGRTLSINPIFRKREYDGVFQYYVVKESLVNYLKIKFPKLVDKIDKSDNIDKEGDKHIHEKMKDVNVTHPERYSLILEVNPSLVDNTGSICSVFLSYGMKVDEEWMNSYVKKKAQELIEKCI